MIQCLPTFSDHNSSILCNLEYLDLGKNRISVVPTSFILALCSNEGETPKNGNDRQMTMNDFVKQRRAASALKHLYLDQNRISRIPCEIAELDSLEVLHIQDNCLSEIPANVCTMQSMKSASASFGIEWLLYVDPPLKCPFPPPNSPSDTMAVFIELAEQMC